MTNKEKVSGTKPLNFSRENIGCIVKHIKVKKRWKIKYIVVNGNDNPNYTCFTSCSSSSNSNDSASEMVALSELISPCKKIWYIRFQLIQRSEQKYKARFKNSGFILSKHSKI